MATLFQRTTALTLLVWYVTLSAGGYALHDLVGSCHAPQCLGGAILEFDAFDSPSPSTVTPATQEARGNPPTTANCCSFHSCRKIARAPGIPSASRKSREVDLASDGMLPEPEMSDSVLGQLSQEVCPLCQWLGQISLPAPYTPPLLDQELHVASSTYTSTPSLPPTWRPFAPRAPPAGSESSRAPSSVDRHRRVGSTDVPFLGSSFARS
jgi:hypothetical protein